MFPLTERLLKLLRPCAIKRKAVLRRSLNTVFLRRAVHIFAEGAVEIADIAVTAVERYGAYGHRSVAQHIAGGAHAVIIQIFGNGHVDLRLEKTAELSLAHVKPFGKRAQGERAAVIFAYIL